MKILFINRWVGYNEGGNETHIKELISMFQKRGEEVHVMTTGRSALKDLGHRIKIWNVESPHSYYYTQSFGYIKAMFFVFKAFFVFIKLWLRGERYDVISVHFSLEAFLARLIRAIFGIPYVMVFAGDTDLELIEGKYADARIQISEYMAKECEFYEYRPQVIPKGIDLDRFNPSVDGYDVRRKYAPNNEKLILTVCRLEPRKNLETLILCAKIIKDKQKKIKFIIIGDGVEKNKLERLIKELELQGMVVLVGAIPYFSEELPRYYRASDLFVLPTLYEGFGWVFMEAMACGLPIITTDVGSNPEIVGDVGILLPPKRADLFAYTILNLLNDGEKQQIMCRKGFNRISKYAWDKIIPQYASIYEKAARKKEGFVKRIVLYILSMLDIAAVIIKKNRMGKNKWGPKQRKVRLWNNLEEK